MRVTRSLPIIAATILVLVSLTIVPGTAQAQQAPRAAGLVVVESAQSFEQTWSSLLAALDANPNIRTIASVDHAAAAQGADLSLDGNRVVFFGNPVLGTPIMQASRSAGLDLPQKMQVFEEAGSVFVAYNPPAYLGARHQTGAVPTLVVIEGALAGLARAATNTEGGVQQPTAPVPGAGAGLVTTTSANDFETTWTKLLAAIDGSPASVAFTVDHGANSGGALAPTRLVVFGNPQIGTPIMADSATAGVDLPLKMLVFEDDAGVTHVTSTSPGYVQSRHGVGAVATIGGASNAIANFTRAATTGPATPQPPAGPDEVQGEVQLAFTGASPLAGSAAVALLTAGGAFAVTSRRRRTDVTGSRR